MGAAGVGEAAERSRVSTLTDRVDSWAPRAWMAAMRSVEAFPSTRPPEELWQDARLRARDPWRKESGVARN